MRIEPSSRFQREYKRLSKKFPSVRDELRELIVDLRENPELGTSLGNNCFKIRLPIASKGVGKSGGARVITYVRLLEDRIALLSIYDKSEQSNISDKDILNIIKDL
jgi:hypothetical protein